MHRHHYVQEESSLRWVIEHQLNCTPFIDVYAISDESETPRRVRPRVIEYLSENEIHLHFSTLQKGFAFLT